MSNVITTISKIECGMLDAVYYSNSRSMEFEAAQGGGSDHLIRYLALEDQFVAFSGTVDRICEVIKNTLNISFPSIGFLPRLACKVFYYSTPIVLMLIKNGIFPEKLKEMTTTHKRPPHLETAKLKRVVMYIFKYCKFQLLYFLHSVIPDSLSARTIRVVNFLEENLGSMTQLAFITLNIALVFFNQYAYAIPVLFFVIYNFLVEKGFVCQTIRTFMEYFMPTIRIIATFLSGGVILKVFALLELLLESGKFSQLLVRLMDVLPRIIIRWGKGRRDFGARISKINAPLKTPKLTDDQVRFILQEKKLKVNLSSCFKGGEDIIKKIPQNRAFSSFKKMFDEIDWKEEEQYKVLLCKCLDDDRFQSMLKDEGPSKDQEERPPIQKEKRKALLERLRRVAKKKNKEEKDFVINWCKDQMAETAQTLIDGKKAVGTMELFEKVQESAARVLWWLLKKERKPVEKEDTLATIAISMGSYCVRGQSQVIEELEAQVVTEFSKEDASPVDLFKDKLFYLLKTLRSNIFDGFVHDMVYAAEKRKFLGKNASTDVHMIDLIRPLGLGFIVTEISPLSYILSLYKKYVTPGLFQQMIKKYEDRINDVDDLTLMAEASNWNLSRFCQDFALEYITKNHSKMLEEISAGSDFDTRGFIRLTLVMLGVLKPKSPPYNLWSMSRL